MKIIKVIDFKTDEEVDIPAKYDVCPRCGGEGHHDHPAFSNGFSASDDFVDEDFLSDYKEGRYNVPCEECKGLRVILVPDLTQLDDKQKDIITEYQNYLNEIKVEKLYRQKYQF